MRFASLSWLAVSVGLVSALPATAFAADDCPPGDWFCEPTEGAPPAADAQPRADEKAPEEVKKPSRRERIRRLHRRHRQRHPLPRVEVTPGPPPPDWVGPEYEPPPPPRYYQRWRPPQWGLGIHGFGALLGASDAHPDAGMGGAGLTLRLRPIPAFAIDAVGEFGFGRDYNGDRRNEQTLLLNAVGFINPRSPAQIYFFGGIGFGSARVRLDSSDRELHPTRFTRRYNYVGVNGGLGLELRLLRSLAVHADVVTFLREHVGGSSAPEFVEPETGRTSDTSAGALIRLGAVLYW